MTTDDVLAYLASKPKRDRPTELRSDARMLAIWLRMRNDKEFEEDFIRRHGLHFFSAIDETIDAHEHAIGNAWGHCMQVFTEEMSGNDVKDR